MDQTTFAETSLRLKFSEVGEILPGLDAAVQSLMRAANRDRGCGILIIRHSPGDYTATLDSSVKFGETVARIVG